MIQGAGAGEVNLKKILISRERPERMFSWPLLPSLMNMISAKKSEP
jgi:hypothetical protein